jgi:hypothetical protein
MGRSLRGSFSQPRSLAAFLLQLCAIPFRRAHRVL